jgi:hypothetical protein
MLEKKKREVRELNPGRMIDSHSLYHLTNSAFNKNNKMKKKF